MSATTCEEQFITVAKPVSPRPTRVGSREDDFRAALDIYMASYAEAQTARRGFIARGKGAIAWPRRWLAGLLPIAKGVAFRMVKTSP